MESPSTNADGGQESPPPGEGDAGSIPIPGPPSPWGPVPAPPAPQQRVYLSVVTPQDAQSDTSRPELAIKRAKGLAAGGDAADEPPAEAVAAAGEAATARPVAAETAAEPISAGPPAAAPAPPPAGPETYRAPAAYGEAAPEPATHAAAQTGPAYDTVVKPAVGPEPPSRPPAAAGQDPGPPYPPRASTAPDGAGGAPQAASGHGPSGQPAAAGPGGGHPPDGLGATGQQPSAAPGAAEWQQGGTPTAPRHATPATEPRTGAHAQAPAQPPNVLPGTENWRAPVPGGDGAAWTGRHRIPAQRDDAAVGSATAFAGYAGMPPPGVIAAPAEAGSAGAGMAVGQATGQGQSVTTAPVPGPGTAAAVPGAPAPEQLSPWLDQPPRNEPRRGRRRRKRRGLALAIGVGVVVIVLAVVGAVVLLPGNSSSPAAAPSASAVPTFAAPQQVRSIDQASTDPGSINAATFFPPGPQTVAGSRFTLLRSDGATPCASAVSPVLAAAIAGQSCTLVRATYAAPGGVVSTVAVLALDTKAQAEAVRSAAFSDTSGPSAPWLTPMRVAPATGAFGTTGGATAGLTVLGRYVVLNVTGYTSGQAVTTADAVIPAAQKDIVLLAEGPIRDRMSPADMQEYPQAGAPVTPALG